MKKYILLLLLLSCKISAQGYTTDVVYETPTSQINIYIVSQGFTESCMPLFDNFVSGFLSYLWGFEPYTTLQPYFRVIRVRLPSSVLSSPGANFQFANAPNLNAYLCNSPDDACQGPSNQYQSSECLVDFEDRMESLSTTLPGFNSKSYIIAVFNNNYYTGFGGRYCMVTRRCGYASMYQVAMHEFSHTFGLLGDEYSDNTPILYGQDCLPILDAENNPVHVNPDAFPLFHDRNVTNRTNPSEIPWQYLIQAGSPGIGTFLGANYTSTNWYRPATTCKMREISTSFCQVCQDLITERVREHLCFDTNNVTENFVSRHQYITHWRKASNLLTSNSTIGNNISVNYLSGNGITLTNGFKSESGSDFWAYIGDCSLIPVQNNYRESDENSSNNLLSPKERPKPEDAQAILLLSPNPVNSVLKVTMEYDKIVQVQLYNLSGGLLYDESITANEQLKLDLSGYKKGTYVLVVTSEKGKYLSEKIFKN